MYRTLRLTRDIDYGIKGLGFAKGQVFVQVPQDTTRLGYLAIPVNRISAGNMPVPNDPRAVFLPQALVEVLRDVADYEELQQLVATL